MADEVRALAEEWAVHWKWEWFKTGGYDPPRFRRGYAGRSCRFLAELLMKHGCDSVLDCSCGCGPKTIVLSEMGYDVMGTDFCGFAVEKARALSRRLGLDIPFVEASWQELSAKLDRTFDCVVNDALAWEPSRAGLEAAAAELAGVLEPGGIVVFQAAVEGSGPESRERCYAQAEESIERFTVRGPFQRGRTRMIQVTVRRLLADGIEVTDLYVVEERGKVSLEHATLAELFRWSWDDLVAAFAAAGFADLHSETAVAGGEERVLNVAVR